MDSIKGGANVFLSFGEIDCRPNEGFILAATKLNRKIEGLVSDTIKGYVNWFSEQGKNKKHKLFFFNVPAPTYQKGLSLGLNKAALRTTRLFNHTLAEYLLENNLNLIDMFNFTVGSDGFSNGIFHIDGRHLSSDAIPEIEKQLYTQISI